MSNELLRAKRAAADAAWRTYADAVHEERIANFAGVPSAIASAQRKTDRLEREAQAATNAIILAEDEAIDRRGT